MEEILGLGPDRRGVIALVRGGRIVGFGPKERDAFPGVRWLDCEDCRLVPGFVNAHTHLYCGLLRHGLAGGRERPRSFLHAQERIWWPLVRALDRESLRAAARYYVAEALLLGTTTVIDHHESPGCIEGSLQVLAEVCEELGIRAVLSYAATERDGGREEACRGLAECRRFLLGGGRRLVRGAVGLHASFTVSDETIAEAGQLCRETGAVLHLHLAEDVCDVRDARTRGYYGPLERLEQFGALPPGSILAHGVCQDRDQVRKARKLGLWLVQNPRSNAAHEVGYPRALHESDRVALGTDGFVSDLRAEEAFLLEEGAKHGEERPAMQRRLPAGRELAAERFGCPLQPLRPGTAADVVALGNRRPRHVLVAGRVVVEDGRLVTGDFAAIREEAREQAARVRARLRRGG